MITLENISTKYGEDYGTLGLDTELLVHTRAGRIYPHHLDCPQFRPRKNSNSMWLSEHGDWHGDGFAWEWCVNPDYCLDGHMLRHSRGLQHLEKAVPSFVGIEAPALYEIPTEDLVSAPPEVRRLGCSPSLNIYDDPGDPTSLATNARTTGCHIHITHTSLTPQHVPIVVRWMDVLAGTMWTLVSPLDPITEAQRRLAYGRAGEYRIRNYPCAHRSSVVFGIEYRVLPGAVFLSPAALTLCSALVRQAVWLGLSNTAPSDEIVSLARLAINHADRQAALSVWSGLHVSGAGREVLGFLTRVTFEPLAFDKLVNTYQRTCGYRRVYEGFVLSEGYQLRSE